MLNWLVLPLVVGSLLLAFVPSGRASNAECLAGGSAATPLDYDDPATWNPISVPDDGTDVLLAEACHVRCANGECRARTLRGTHAGASIEIAAGAALVLSGCEDAAASNPTTYECGGENGFRFAPQGALVHDSKQHGDVLVRGGPARGQVYRVANADVSVCPDPARMACQRRSGRATESSTASASRIRCRPNGCLRRGSTTHPRCSGPASPRGIRGFCSGPRRCVTRAHRATVDSASTEPASTPTSRTSTA